MYTSNLCNISMEYVPIFDGYLMAMYPSKVAAESLAEVALLRAQRHAREAKRRGFSGKIYRSWDFYMEYVWNMYGICMEYVWNMYGIFILFLGHKWIIYIYINGI